jgi:hypothetical protein
VSPIRKVKGGYKVARTTTKKPLTKRKARAQLAAIKIHQAKKRGKR